MITTATPSRPHDAQRPAIPVVAAAALDHAEAIARRWLPEGKRHGREWVARNPTRDDRHPGSFSVNLDTGAWADFATDDHGGDLVSLVAYLEGTRQGPAADAVAQFLGPGLVERATMALSGARKAPPGPSATAVPATDKGSWRALVPVPADAPAPPQRHPRHGTPVAAWTYRDAVGRTLSHVLRFTQSDGDKAFRPLTYCEHPDGARSWRWQGPPEPRPLDRLDRLTALPEATVIICEGEKAADAANHLLPEPAYVATTSPNGAASPGKSNWSPLAGRRVCIWPDHDAPGAAYASQVAGLARKAGAASVEVLETSALQVDPKTGEPRELPPGWDAADAQSEGLPSDAIRQIVDIAEVQAVQTAEPKTLKMGTSPYQLIEFTKGYRNGVYFCGEDAQGEPLPPQLICSPLRVTARTRDGRNANWGYLLEWEDPDGHPHQWAMPAELLSGSGDAYRSVLLDGGLYIAPGTMARNHLTSYIQGTHTAVRARCTDRTGWHGAAFVLPDRVIGDQGGERVIFQSTTGAANYYGTAGTLEDWQREIAALCCGNSRLTFSISTAFASVLLDLLGDENGGVHLQGPSSEGKSAACYAAASVFGARDYLHRWRATTNGLEAVATSHSGALLILDEIGQVDPREAGEIAYMLANGTGKHRAERSGGARRAPCWRLLLLSRGEIDLAQHMLSAGKRARAGQEVRLLSVPANPGSGLGICETLHGFANGAELSKAIKARTRRYYGTAGPAFVERVANEIEQFPALLRSVRMSFLDAHLPGEASGEVHRAADRFALIAVGGELATRFGITGWPAGAAGQAAASCFRAWIDGRGGTGSRETAAILSQVRRFFEAHGEARFHNWDMPNERPIVNRAGVRKRDGETWIYYVLPETFREDLGAGYDSKAVIQVLDQAGLLIHDKYEGKPAGNVRLPGIGMTRCYQIRPFGEQVT